MLLYQTISSYCGHNNFAKVTCKFDDELSNYSELRMTLRIEPTNSPALGYEPVILTTVT